MKKAYLILILLILIIPFASAETYYVNGSYKGNYSNGTIEFPYKLIMDAINISINKDIIYVSEGFYNESIVINKSISLIGRDQEKTIIHGANSEIMEGYSHNCAVGVLPKDVERFNLSSQWGSVIEVWGNDITINNFTLEHGRGYRWDAGVYLHEHAHNNILSNILIIKDTCNGIYSYRTSNDKIFNIKIGHLGHKGIFLKGIKNSSFDNIQSDISVRDSTHSSFRNINTSSRWAMSLFSGFENNIMYNYSANNIIFKESNNNVINYSKINHLSFIKDSYNFHIVNSLINYSVNIKGLEKYDVSEYNIAPQNMTPLSWIYGLYVNISSEIELENRTVQIRIYFNKENMEKYKIDLKDLRIKYYDNGTWININTTLSKDQTHVYANVSHFSFYALGKDEKEPQENPPSGGGSSGGGGSGSPFCYHEWKCSDWSYCYPSGIQSRNCVYSGSCLIKENKPALTQECKYIKIETCWDLKQNQNEEGIDCGGICIEKYNLTCKEEIIPASDDSLDLERSSKKDLIKSWFKENKYPLILLGLIIIILCFLVWYNPNKK